MNKKKLTKLKKHKGKKYQEEEEEESEGEDQYQVDEFLVPDDEVEEGEGVENVYNFENKNLPDAVIESDLASSDLDIVEEEGKQGKKKKLRRARNSKMKEMEDVDQQQIKNENKAKSKKFVEEEDNGNNNENDNYNDDILKFIDDDQVHLPKIEKSKGGMIRNSLPHQIFSLENADEQMEQEPMIKDEKQITQQIYPGEELEEEYATVKDRKTKLTDIPERILLQYPDESLGTLSKDVEAEAEWILEKVKTQISNIEMIGSVKKKITQVLELYKKDFLDIPYISLYRKTFDPELTLKDMWKIFELDKEWRKLSEYKANAKKQYATIVRYMESKMVEFLEKRYIDNAKSIRELKDVEAFISFMKEFNMDDVSNAALQEDQHTLIRPIKKSIVQDIKSSRIHEFIRKFALTSHELALNLELMVSGDAKGKLILPQEPKEEPVHLAYKYVNSMYDQEIKVMTQACRFLALEMFSYPYIRQFAWNYFRGNCTLSTEPSDDGRKELDVFHPSYRIKRLVKKPIESFNNDLYLDIVQNENKNFIKVRIDCEEDMKNFMERISSAYSANRQESGTIVYDTPQKWQVMRDEATRMLVVEYLLPEFKKEIRQELWEKAENFVIQECAAKFNALLMTGPYRKSLNESEDDKFRDDDLPKVMSFVYDNSKNELYSINLDQNGEVLDHQVFNYLINKPNKFVKSEEKQIYYDDHAKCKELIQKYRPDLIVIGANDLKCRYLKEQISACDPDSKNNDESSFWITFGDLSIPRIYANSSIAEKHFPNYSFYLRMAVSLGRLKQNPLEEILQLWNEDVNKNNCLSINLHPLQKLVNQAKLSELLEMEAIQAVNTVGVDINRAYEFPHLRAPLAFVSGLGPRKASYILESLMPFGGLQMRTQLGAKGILGKKVFINCSGFLKIKTDPSKHTSSTRKYDLLDMTRINPELYALANKLILSAVDDEEKSKENIDKTEIVLRDPKRLNVLDFNEYIKKCEDKNYNYNIKYTIHFILNELFHPFKDQRHPHKDLTTTELFFLMIGDENFRVGQITLARVVMVDSQHVKCRLMNDLEATVWIKDIFEEEQIDKVREKEMQEKYKVGMLFEARIKYINEHNFKVDLATKPSMMMTHKQSMQVHHLDKYFQISEEDIINKNYQEEIKSEQKKYIPRNIKHPAFRNVTFNAAVELLRNRDIGECVFRPSSKGVNNLTLSWKFYKYVFSHIDIQEEDKLPGASIGAKLRISNETYSSINEIIERYVNPCAKIVKDLINSRKFCHFDSAEDLEKRLKEDKAKDQSIIHYLFTILTDYPQYIVMGYAAKVNTITREYIKVKPKGLYFHDEYFITLDELILWFKKNYGNDSYRDYVKKVRPPIVEERRKINKDPNEFDAVDSAMGDSMEKEKDKDKDIPHNFATTSNFSNTNPNFMPSSLHTFPMNKSFTCNNCGQPGHFQKDCTQRRESSSRDNKRQDSGNTSYVQNKRKRSPEHGGMERDFKERRTEENGTTWGQNEKVSTGWGQTDMKMETDDAINNKNNSRNQSSSWGNSNQTGSNTGWGSSEPINSGFGDSLASSSVPESSNRYSDNKRERSNDNRGNFERGRGYKGSRGGDRGNGWGGRGRGGRDREGRSSPFNKEQSSSNDGWSKPNNNEESSWGNKSNQESGWGKPQAQAESQEVKTMNNNNDTSTWGKSSNNDISTNTKSNSNETSSWGKSNNNEVSTWGKSTTKISDKANASCELVKEEEQNIPLKTDAIDQPTENVVKASTAALNEKGKWGASSNTTENPGWGASSATENPSWGSSTNPTPKEKPVQISMTVDENLSWGNTTSNNLQANTGWGSSNKESNKTTDTAWGASSNEYQASSTQKWGDDTDNSNNNLNSWNSPNRTFGSGNRQGGGDRRREGGNFNKDGNKKGCFKCGDEGHFSRDCPNQQKRPEKRSNACFKCGEEGHQSRECPNPKKERKGGNSCFNCGEEGHQSRECPNPKKERKGGNSCFNCGEEGHMSRECPNPKKERKGGNSCFNCGEEGHQSRECPNPKKERKGGNSCFNCGEEGHQSRECPNPKKERKGGNSCFNCGEEGHQSRECPNPKKERKGGNSCFNCGEEGHMSRECTKPRSNRGGRGGDRGRGRGGGRGGFRVPDPYDNHSPISDNNVSSPIDNTGWGSPNANISQGWGSSSTTEGGWGKASSQTKGNSNVTTSLGESVNNAGSSWGNNNNNDQAGNSWGNSSSKEQGENAWGSN